MNANGRVGGLLVCGAVFLLVLISVDNTIGQIRCTISANKLVYAYSPLRRPDDANNACVARFLVNVLLPFNRSGCTGRNEEMQVRWPVDGEAATTVFNVKKDLLNITDRNLYSDAFSDNTDTFDVCITKLGIEKMLVTNTDVVKFQVTYIAKPCGKEALCVRKPMINELRNDNEPMVTSVGSWFETNGARENATMIRCHDDRVATPFVKGSFVLQADAVDNDVVVSRAGSNDAFEYSEIQFWNESAEVTFRLLSMTGVDEVSAPTGNGSDVLLVSILVQSMSNRTCA
jgi:hypothetical protein